MSYPGSSKTIYNDEPQIVPVAFATMTSSQDQEQSELQSPENPPASASAEAVQVLGIVDDSYGEHSSHQPLQQGGHTPISPNPNTAIDPTVIQVVTFDEQPSEIGGETWGRLNGRQESNNVGHESTPLLHQNGNDPYANNINDDEKYEGRAECHDMIWAILFYCHIAGVLYAGIHLAPQGYDMIETDQWSLEKLHDFMEQNFVNDDDFSMKDLDMLTHFLHQFQEWWSVYPLRIGLFICSLCFIAILLKLFKTIMKGRIQFFVSTSLVLFGVMIGLLVVMLLSDAGFFGFVVSVILIGALAVYIRNKLWPKIEFAALNLEIALAAIGDNLGTYVWVICCSEVALYYFCFWCYTVLGLIPYVTSTKCPEMKFDASSEEKDTCGATNGVVLSMLLSLYWTLSHAKATIQVYVAGVMGTWCFDKEAAHGWCSSAVTSSMYRSLTFSSGPIAFGSLLQTPAKVLRSILSHSNFNQHRTNQQAVYDHGDDCHCCCFGLCGLVLECLADVFGEVLDYFSQWAYVFVGINGTSYLESGKAVTNLFRERGWTAMITDRVVAIVLGVGAFHGGILTGLISILVERLVTWMVFSGNASDDLPPSYIFGSLKNIPLVSFTLGFVVGCVVSAIMMNVIQGAVNTLIVCWAESPESFRDNHKYWADQITDVWASAFPATQFPGANNAASARSTSLGTRYGATTVMP